MANKTFEYNVVFRVTGEREVEAAIQRITTSSGRIREIGSAVKVVDDSYKSLISTAKKYGLSQQAEVGGIYHQVQAFRELVAQNDAVIAVARRRNELTEEGRAILERNVASFDKFIDALLISSNAGDEQSNSFVRANRVISEFSNESRNAENAIKRFTSQSSLSTKQLTDTESSVRRLRDETDLLQQEYIRIRHEIIQSSLSLEEAEPILKGYLEELQNIEAQLLALADAQGTDTKTRLSSLKALQETREILTEVRGATVNMSGAFTGLNKRINSANQLLFSLGDILEDSKQFQFSFANGMRAIGNNISFASEQLILMTKNIKESGEEDIGEVLFGDLLEALKGPAGILVAVNAAITAFTLLAPLFRDTSEEAGGASRSIMGASDSIKDAAESINIFAEAVKALRGEGRLELGREQELQSQKRDAEAALEVLKKISDQREEIRKLNREQFIIEQRASALEGFGSLSPGLTVQDEARIRQLQNIKSDYQEIIDELTEDLVVLGFTADDTVDSIGETIEQLDKSLDAYNSGLDDVAADAGARVETIREETQRAITEFTLGISTSDDAIRELISSYQAQIPAQQDTLRELEHGTEQYKNNSAALEAMVSALEELQGALETTEEKQTKVNKATQDYVFLLKQARLQQAIDEFIRAGDTELAQAAIQALRDLRVKNAKDTIEDADQLNYELFRINSEYWNQIFGMNESEEERIAKEQDERDKEQDERVKRHLEQLRRTREAQFELDFLKAKDQGESNEFLQQMEIDRVKRLYDAEILLKSEFELEVYKIQQKYRKLREKDNDKESQSRRQNLTDTLDYVSQALGALQGLNSSYTAQNEEQARRQFEANKKLSYASAVVAGAKAVVEALGNPAQMAIAIATTGIQLAAISRQKFEYGGGGIEGDDGGSSGFGFQMNEVEGPTTFNAPNFMPGDGSAQPKIVVNNELRATNKQLYLLTKTGERDQVQTQV